MVDRIASADALARPSRGLAPRPKADQVRVLLASGTNVAVDRWADYFGLSTVRDTRYHPPLGPIFKARSLHSKEINCQFREGRAALERLCGVLGIVGVVFVDRAGG